MTQNLNDDFALFAGELAEGFSFNRSVGQIYGLLYLSREPVSLDDIAKRLKMSKGNASINLRFLEEWGAVRQVTVSGTRRDYYEANLNIKEIVLRRLREGLSKRLDRAQESLQRLLSNLDRSGEGALDPSVRKRLEELRSLVSKGQKALRILPKTLKLFLG